MQVTLFGAAGEVTGSCYLLETKGARVLIDCGMFQGSRKLERLNTIPHKLSVSSLDAVVCTHAHLDHTGRLPLLVKRGYRGPIYCTNGSLEVIKLILRDAAKVQEQDVLRVNRHRRRDGLKLISPLFSFADVEQTCRQLRGLDYDRIYQVAGEVSVELVEAGHILGSSSIKLYVEESGAQKTVVFSGDLGAYNAPIMRDPASIEGADAVFIESTYGDRNHRDFAETLAEFEQLVRSAVDRKGKILVPSFAVGRTQLILYELAALFRNKKVKPFPIYIDSPMAIAATELYNKHALLFDEEATGLRKSGQLRQDLATVRHCQTADESKALNAVAGPCLIMAGAGMCNAGRILHHLRHNLPDPATVVMIVGFQIKGSLGRQLLEGVGRVKIFGETVVVRAKVCGLGGFSAHAGQDDLLTWLKPMTPANPRVIITHGEPHPQHCLAAKVKERYGLEAEMPKLGQTIIL